MMSLRSDDDMNLAGTKGATDQEVNSAMTAMVNGLHVGVAINGGTPKKRWLTMENPIQMDDFEVALF